MYQQPLSETPDFLKSARIGMDVYDLDRQRVGKVTNIQFASGTAEEVPSGVDSKLDNLHDVVRARLLESGFIKIDTGFLRADCYAMTNQIIYVDDDVVYLTVAKDGLVRA